MPRHLESQLQRACVKWFRLQYPQFSNLLIAVPNGGYRNVREAARLKGEGVVPGVADMLLLIPRGPYGSLGIEMKAGKGKQSDNQKQWMDSFESIGNLYAVCRSLDEFMEVVKAYIPMKPLYELVNEYLIK